MSVVDDNHNTEKYVEYEQGNTVDNNYEYT